MKGERKFPFPAPTYLLVASALLRPFAAVGEVFDFEDADVGSLPDRWTTIAVRSEAPPLWEVALDTRSPAGVKVLAQTSSQRSFKRTCLAILSDIVLADGTVSVEIEPVSGGITISGGIVWRHVDERNYYVARVSALQRNISVYKVQDGRTHLLGMVGPRTPHDDFNVALPIDVDRWSSLEVRFIGPRFVVRFEDEVVLEVTDTAFSRPGNVGLWTHGDSIMRFDAFAVSDRPIPEE
jgi:hypothetical protein